MHKMGTPYLTEAAVFMCTQFLFPARITCRDRYNSQARCQGKKLLTVRANVQVPLGAQCRILTQLAEGVPQPCQCKALPWQSFSQNTIKHMQMLTEKSFCQCVLGGMIRVQSVVNAHAVHGASLAYAHIPVCYSTAEGNTAASVQKLDVSPRKAGAAAQESFKKQKNCEVNLTETAESQRSGYYVMYAKNDQDSYIIPGPELDAFCWECGASSFQNLRQDTLRVEISEDGGMEFPDCLMVRGSPLISDKFKHILDGENIGSIFYKKIILVSPVMGLSETYWLVLLPRLGFAKAQKHHIFQLAESGREDIIVTEVLKVALDEAKLENVYFKVW